MTLSTKDMVAELKARRDRLAQQAMAFNKVIALLENGEGADIDAPALPAVPAPDVAPKPAGARRRAFTDADKEGAGTAARSLGVHRSVIDRWRRDERDRKITPPTPAGAAGRRPNPIDRSPTAGKGAYVPSGLKTVVDEAAARRAAYGEAS